jgi:multidrug efflux pump subunit AcrA (membrane-fusion protein)
MLQLKKRSLESALAESQREVTALQAQLDRAAALQAELEAAQNEASAAKRHASSARARIALLEKAWANALEVRCCPCCPAALAAACGEGGLRAARAPSLRCHSAPCSMPGLAVAHAFVAARLPGAPQDARQLKTVGARR